MKTIILVGSTYDDFDSVGLLPVAVGFLPVRAFADLAAARIFARALAFDQKSEYDFKLYESRDDMGEKRFAHNSDAVVMVKLPFEPGAANENR